ncbi:MAG TPA: STAS domain-containing protein [Fibrobacteria bacterium]|nr:STAS domain-containing protein [Fibrobacteria bacterium]
MPGFSWKTERPRSGLALLRLEGEMTLGTRESMREAFETLVSAPEPVCAVDFSMVRLVSSGAIGELVRCQSRVGGSGRSLHLVCPPGDVLETLLVADMHRLIPLHPDIDSIPEGNQK